MNFICESCRHASEVEMDTPPEVILLWKRAFHDKCPGGTWCDCQHRIGRKNVQ